MGKMLYDVAHRDAVEVIDLAPRENGGYDFVLLGGGENEYDVARGLFESLEKSVEGS